MYENDKYQIVCFVHRFFFFCWNGLMNQLIYLGGEFWTPISSISLLCIAS